MHLISTRFVIDHLRTHEARRVAPPFKRGGNSACIDRAAEVNQFDSLDFVIFDHILIVLDVGQHDIVRFEITVYHVRFV